MPNSSITIALDRSSSGYDSAVEDDLRLHYFNEFLSALREGYFSSADIDHYSALEAILAAIGRKLREERSSGELFSIDLTSRTDPSCGKITWTMDFRSEFKAKR